MHQKDTLGPLASDDLVFPKVDSRLFGGTGRTQLDDSSADPAARPENADQSMGHKREGCKTYRDVWLVEGIK